MDSFWQMLAEGRDCITEVPADRWSIEQYYDPNPQTPGKTNSKYGGFVGTKHTWWRSLVSHLIPRLENLKDFDPQLFGISPREATSLDPQQRMLLEVTYEVLEDAGMIFFWIFLQLKKELNHPLTNTTQEWLLKTWRARELEYSLDSQTTILSYPYKNLLYR
jgi:Beta-ketoacyl synthase, N-terminal domain